ncbi:hypothetical protein [Allomuricauda sp. SCSIO 65647]|uniref:hypothetical protein n=1 Tax=Allomuricauda sp. SCSIO 65647 TaxID=2908843 RepID=UPI001F275DD7|nr:hypothetical protein [Muricauda sp. SCSIO 65647]UJH68811.1 hypothetical protein L0P89_06230 [Muricauda sp. SCSIO 65647]
MRSLIIGFICFSLICCSNRKSKKEIDGNIDLEKVIMKEIDLKNWTDTPHVVGRLATESDVNSGAATFVIDGQGQEHKPLDIRIPSLAFHVDVDTKEKTPVVVIQGEQVGEQKVVGIKYLDGSDGVCTLGELEFVSSPSEFEN